jgi:hypothetical protein
VDEETGGINEEGYGMIIYLIQGLKIDTDKPHGGFDVEEVRKAFRNYTQGTAPEFTWEDKLSFIDRAVEKLRTGDKDGEEAIIELMTDCFKCQLEEGLEIPERDDFYTLEFLSECFEAGVDAARLNSDRIGLTRKIDGKASDAAKRYIYELVHAVINYDESQEDRE